MKRKGSVFQLADERDDDIMQNYIKLLNEAKKINLYQIRCRLVNMPSKRFWVTAERASIVISSMQDGDKLLKMHPTKREMYNEIYRRVQECRQKDPTQSIYNIVSNVISSPAPKFYLTPGSTRMIIYKIKREWIRKNMQGLYRL